MKRYTAIDISAHGFTLIEILLVFSLMTILVSFLVPEYLKFNRKQTLTQVANTIVEDIKQAQVFATGGVQGAASFVGSYEIELINESGEPANIYRGYHTNQIDSNGQPIATIDTENLVCPVCLISDQGEYDFKVPTGNLNNVATFQTSFSVCYQGIGSYTINLDQAGKIYRGGFDSSSCSCPATCF